MISLSKITVSDKVSSWIQLVNNIVDIVNNTIDNIKLAVAPSRYDTEGNPMDGNDGYISRMDKKKLDELETTYMPIRGELPSEATWTKATVINSSNAFNITVESSNVILYTKGENLSIQVNKGTKDDYAIKYLCLLPGDNDYTCSISFSRDESTEPKVEKTYCVSAQGGPVVLRFILISGIYFVYEEGKLEFPNTKTINGESIFGIGDIDLVAPDELKTINGEALIGDGDIHTLQAEDFKTVNDEVIVGDGNIRTLQPLDFKTVNGEFIIGDGDIDVISELELKTINGESLVGEGDIVVLQSSNFKTINGELIIGEGDIVTLQSTDFKTINGENIVGIGDIITLRASDFKTINGESLIGTGDIIISTQPEQPSDYKSRLGKARLGELILK
jgi:hypothetical protein